MSKRWGAVTTGDQPKFHFRFVRWFDSDSFLAFLNQLISRYKGRKIHLIVDNAKYHKGPKVRKWLKGKEKQIRTALFAAVLAGIQCNRVRMEGNSEEDNPQSLLQNAQRIQEQTVQEIQPISRQSGISEERTEIIRVGLSLYGAAL